MSSESYHEPYEELTAETRDMHRAIESLMEELEAVDWYNQRIQVTTDDELKGLLVHNRDEEKSTPPWCSSGSAAATRSSTSN